METVRLLEEHEFPPQPQKYFEGTKVWFNTDYVPKMSRLLSYIPEMVSTHGLGELTRCQKEMIAVTVSAINACAY
jgi:hypothetical protein